MKEEEPNLDRLEEVKFEIDKGAYNPKTVTCSRCNLKMQKAELDINLGSGIGIKVSGFECSKCKKKYLGLEQSRRLDKAMMINRILRDDFKIERSLSFDGDNFTFRIPKEFTQNVKKRKVEIMPLGSKKFCASIQ